jgi:hypothetical protein
MFKKILTLSLCLIAITVLVWQSHRVNAGTLPTGNTGSFANPEAADEPHPFIRYGANQEFRLDLSDGTETADTNGVKWKLGVESAAVAGQPEAGLVISFDNVRIEQLSHSGNTVKFRLTNPTKFATDVSVLVESGQEAKKTVGSFVLKPLPVVHLDAGASKILEYTASGSL